MPLPTSVGFLAIGSGILVRAWRDSATADGATSRKPAIIAVATLAVTILAWLALVGQERDQAMRLVQSQAFYLRSAIAKPVDAQIRTIAVMAEQWQANPPSEVEWLAAVPISLGPDHGYQTVEVVDGSNQVRWRVPMGQPELAGPIADARTRALEAARNSQSMAVSPLVEIEGAKAFFVVAPVSSADTSIVGLFRFTDFLRRVVAQEAETGYELAVYDGPRLVYGRALTGELPREWMSNLSLGVRGEWQLSVWPTTDRLAEVEGRMPTVILGAGLLLSAVVTCMTFFAGTSRRREEQLRESARMLQEQINEREAAEVALRASEERYRSLVDSATDIIYRVDANGHFTFVNPVASRVMHRPQSKLVGMHFLELIEPAARGDVARFYGDQVQRRIPSTYYEFPAVDGRGNRLWLGQNVELLIENGSIVGLQAVARDVTDQKLADAELARARDAALQSDRLKSEFVANVSHELRTPMNGILGLTEALLETELTKEQREQASTVHECGETLLILLNDILDLSKVEAGKLEIQPVAFDLRRLVQQTADLFGDRARKKGVDVVYLVHHDVPETIVADPGRLRQILTNLLGNAVKFTERGEITLRVRVEDASSPQMLIRLEVTDTGIGISPEAQAQLFQPFVQADGSITRKYGGTGLGLVISRQLAMLMGGEMGMNSQMGQGSTFWFTLRTVAAPTPAVARPAVPSLRGIRVLALDDSESGRRRMRELLESWGMLVADADCPEMALAALKSADGAGEPFDAAIVELRNVGADPLEFAAAAHAAGLVPPTRLILLSGRGQPGDAQRAHQLGAVAYLTKPILQSQLFDCLATVMGPPQDEPSEPATATGIVTRYTLDERPNGRPPLLVIEDNVVNQKVLVGLLRKIGYHADVANNGEEALAALERTAYPLVFMDSQMPVMDGFATTAAIRQREGDTRHTVIVAVTAHAMKGERERCIAAGMDDYISKPVSRDRLAEVVTHWLTDQTDNSPVAAPANAADSQLVLSPPAGAVDLEVIRRLRELDSDMPGVFGEVITTFLRETPARIDRIRTALEASEAAELQRAAHGLKGSAGAVGAMKLAALCGEIERHAEGGAMEACAVPVKALATEYHDVEESMQRLTLRAEVA